MLLSSSLEDELNGVILGSEDKLSVESELDSSAEKDVDGISLSCEVLEIGVEPAIVLLASVELSAAVEDVTSMLLVDNNDSELSKEVGPPLVAVILPDSVDAVLLSASVLVGSVENSDVSLLRSVLSGPVDDREVETPVGSLCDEDSASVDNEASLLVLTTVVDGPGVGPEGDVFSVEMLP